MPASLRLVHSRPPDACADHALSPEDRQRLSRVRWTLTDSAGHLRRMRHCLCCAKPIRADLKTGLCRPCWEARRTAAAAAVDITRRTLPMVRRSLKAACERAKAEDAGVGLLALMELQRDFASWLNDAGRAVVARDGETNVAAEVGRAKQTVWERWGSER
jgi:hypothetical protein